MTAQSDLERARDVWGRAFACALNARDMRTGDEAAAAVIAEVLATLRAERDAAEAEVARLREAALMWANAPDQAEGEQQLLDACDLVADDQGLFVPRAMIASIRGR